MAPHADSFSAASIPLSLLQYSSWEFLLKSGVMNKGDNYSDKRIPLPLIAFLHKLECSILRSMFSRFWRILRSRHSMSSHRPKTTAESVAVISVWFRCMLVLNPLHRMYAVASLRYLHWEAVMQTERTVGISFLNFTICVKFEVN